MMITPQFLGIYANLYGSNDSISVSRALLVAVVGFFTVVCILAVIALFIKFIAFVFAIVEKRTDKKELVIQHIDDSEIPSVPAKAMRGQVELIDVDEPTAAVIMALVSHQSGIDINRLDFKSIRLMEDE